MSKEEYYDKGKKFPLIKSDSFNHSKLHHEVYQIPPWTQQHLKAILLNFMNSPHFVEPTHQDSLWETIRSFYKNLKNAETYMKELDMKQVLLDISKQ